MRFYVPEWDDFVDAEYDFIHDQHSSLATADRQLAYIWDIFDKDSVPIDGVLISREQVEDSPAKFDRITGNGIYNAPQLDIPDWIPTISDCGAWGYKSLPFPPYGNEDMLNFYEQLDVTVGVTIDHLVLGSGHTSRLYLDERALPDDDGFEIPERLKDAVDIMTEEWPDEWPEYVREYESSICVDEITPIDADIFKQPVSDIITELNDHPHAVYRDDDMAFRYELTLKNAKEMKELYDAGAYNFRLMVAIQGWDSNSYVEAAEQVLDMGCQYLGIGGVAGSPEEYVTQYVEAVGNTIKKFERQHSTRIDTHVFGFAKTGAFDTIGKTGMTSFDSASMLRAAWNGGDNYHVDSDERYDAFRVRYPSHKMTVTESVERALRSQEMLHALRAYDADESIATALGDWYNSALTTLEQLKPYLRNHRHDDRFDHSTLRPIKESLRQHFQHGYKIKPNFSGKFQGRLSKLLRRDSKEDPLPFDEYEALLSKVTNVVADWTPTKQSEIERREDRSGELGTFDQLWILVVHYTTHVGDEQHQDGYEELLRRKPWDECECKICCEHGIEVAIFRGNNRNRRRGFHNTRLFYDQFEESLPKTAVLTKGDTGLSNTLTVEGFLREHRPELWEELHDLPVIELGTVAANGIYEWWEDTPASISFAPRRLADNVREYARRYQKILIDGQNWDPTDELVDAVENENCEIVIIDDIEQVRSTVLDSLGYDSDFLPTPMEQSGLTEF